MADINGTHGRDIIFGSFGSDTIDAGKGNDIVLSGRGNDAIDGGAGNDILFAGRGHDVVDGGTGHDFISGGRGNDLLDGGAGSDWVDGGSGCDTLVFNATENRGSHDVYLGGRGVDTLVLQLTAEEAADPALQAEIAYYKTLPSWAVYTFETLGLTVQSLERLVIDVAEPVTQAPVLTDDALTAEEYGPAVTIDLIANDADPDGTDLTITSIDATGLVGELTDNGDGTISFRAGDGFDALAEGATAEQTISYTVTDGNGETATASVTITVRGTNDVPTVEAVVLDAINEDATITFTAAELLAGADDVDEGDELTVASVSVDGVQLEAVDGTFSFTPPADFNGSVTVDFTVTDGTETVASTATFDVTAVNDGPVADDETAAVDEGAEIEGQLEASDVDGDALTFSLDGPVAGLTLAADGFYTFDASAAAYDGLAVGETRDVTAGFTVSDGNGGSDEGEITVTVTGTNDVPTFAALDAGTVSEDDAPLAIDLLDGFNDVDSDTLEVVAVEASTDGGVPVLFENRGGTITIDPDQFGLTLDAGESLTVTGTYDVTDGTVTVENTFTLTVDGRNEVPEAVNDTITTVPSATPVAVGTFAADVEGLDDVDDPFVTSLANGGFVVAWEAEVPVGAEGGQDDVVRAQIFDAAGNASGPSFTAAAGDYTVDDIAITGLSDGGFAIVWEGRVVTEETVDADGTVVTEESSRVDAYTRRFDGDGNPVGPDIVMTADFDGGAPDRAAAVGLDDGTYLALWEFTPSDGEGTDIAVYAQRIGTDGNPVGTTFFVSDVADRGEDEPSAALLEDGRFVIAYEADTTSDPDVFQETIALRVFDADGTPSGDEIVLPVGDENNLFDPEVAALVGGGFAVVWEGSTDTGEDTVFAQAFGADGAPTSGVITVAAGDIRPPFDSPSFDPNADYANVRDIDVTGDPDGGFVVTWERDGARDELLGQRFDATGERVGDEFVVAEDESFSPDVNLTTLENDDIVAVWEDGNDILGRIYTFDEAITEDRAVSIGADRLLANDTDFEDDALSLTGVSATADILGTVSLADDGSVIYDPNGAFDNLGQGESATDTFSYTVTDAFGGTDTATVNVVVQGVDDFIV